MAFEGYEHLLFDRDEGITTITIDRPESFNAANEVLHDELGRVWLDVAADRETRVALITGAGRAFCAGGDLDMIRDTLGDYDRVCRSLEHARALVYNLINLDKPVVAAVNGAAVGAGLSLALMSDISIVAEDAKLSDGHLRLGVAAGDHAAIIWPLLCGMAQAKLLLFTGEIFDGREAARIGLVSMAVPSVDVLPRARQIARQLADGPQQALRWTKRSLNNWLRMFGPVFDNSLALEHLGLFGEDIRRGVEAVGTKRSPNFNTDHF